jgi:hypothetical protein
MWYINEREGLVIKSIYDETKSICAQYNNAALQLKPHIAKDFEYKKQRYLLIACELPQAQQTPLRNLLVVLNLAICKPICAFYLAHEPRILEVLVRGQQFIDNSKNATFLANFEVTVLCGCVGGAVYLIEITPNEHMCAYGGNESRPMEIYWYNSDFMDYEEVRTQKRIAHSQFKLFGLLLNSNYDY